MTRAFAPVHLPCPVLRGSAPAEGLPVGRQTAASTAGSVSRCFVQQSPSAKLNLLRVLPFLCFKNNTGFFPIYSRFPLILELFWFLSTYTTSFKRHLKHGPLQDHRPSKKPIYLKSLTNFESCVSLFKLYNHSLLTKKCVCSEFSPTSISNYSQRSPNQMWLCFLNHVKKLELSFLAPQQ